MSDVEAFATQNDLWTDIGRTAGRMNMFSYIYPYDAKETMVEKVYPTLKLLPLKTAIWPAAEMDEHD